MWAGAGSSAPKEGAQEGWVDLGEQIQSEEWMAALPPFLQVLYSGFAQG